MCGIVGYTGAKSAENVLIEGLKRLEYRGYDSAGVAILENGKVTLRRCKGKVAILENSLAKKPVRGTTGIGHTRWATHGKPSEENAHPHTDCSGKIVIVHNGIIENYLALKKKLKTAGHTFKSETDTEIIAHLIEKNLKSSGSLLRAVQKTTKELRGSYAIGVISADEPGTIVAARKDSPLIAGVGNGENFIASDIPAVLPYTRKVIPLNDGETAKITKTSVKIFGADGKPARKKAINISWSAVMAEKEGYRHFMLKEIFEQPRAVQETLRGKIDIEKNDILIEDANLSGKEIKNCRKIYIVACGTAYHAGLVGKFLLENFAKIPCEVEIGSEFRYRKPLLEKNDLVLIISQSGETADTLAGLRLAQKNGVKTLAICNVLGATATREAGGIIYTHAGPEIGVASTKAFTTQLIALYLLTIRLGRIKKTLSEKEAKKFLNELVKMPHRIRQALRTKPTVEQIAKKYFKKSDFLYLGRNINYPIALEGALKLKEISYIHAEGYPAGEMKHGPIALIDEEMPVLAIATKSKVREKILSNIQEAKTRNGTIIALATAGDRQIKKFADDVIYLPETPEEFSPLVNVVPLQLLAYYIAYFRGCDIDQPRNLAKSVVVE
ncbi:MAG: glutamine--fructose-6-phosphate transaminase (isomerizing) [Elusimicrobia bacterium]|nr:glutamine--fructose-6-phosphate transaminase (isomerizing) [Elusimicrobiota bacterium]